MSNAFTKKRIFYERSTITARRTPGGKKGGPAQVAARAAILQLLEFRSTASRVPYHSSRARRQDRRLCRLRPQPRRPVGSAGASGPCARAIVPRRRRPSRTRRPAAKARGPALAPGPGSPSATHGATHGCYPWLSDHGPINWIQPIWNPHGFRRHRPTWSPTWSPTGALCAGACRYPWRGIGARQPAPYGRHPAIRRQPPTSSPTAHLPVHATPMADCHRCCVHIGVVCTPVFCQCNRARSAPASRRRHRHRLPIRQCAQRRWPIRQCKQQSAVRTSPPWSPTSSPTADLPV